LTDGAVVAGGCLESAAYNPGLTALQSTLAMASLRGAHLPEDIERVVLAERPTTARQTAAAELLLSTWAPGAEFISHLF
jgi:cytidine deaminase